MTDSVFESATVLVVDDHPPNLALFERILRQAGVSKVYVTGDPHAVVDLVRSVRPDLVLLDLHMPGMDGVAVLEAIAADTAADDFVPVIVVTADATVAARDRALAAGANDFLTKPVDRAEVVLRARNLLHTRALHGELRQHNAALRAELARREEADTLARSDRDAQRGRILRVLDAGGPRIVFQPIVLLESGLTIGYEALSRFDEEPYRTPDVWFAEAAAVELGLELELAAVRAALSQLDDLPNAAFVTVNVSPNTVATPAFAQLAVRHPGERVVIEITEHARVSDYDALLGALGELRHRRMRLAVDDAGAGYASLHHILRLRPDIIKLDITIARDIDHDPIRRALASSLVGFGHEIGATITAEGIETADELATLSDLGIPWGQGFHLGRPATIEPSRANIAS